VLIYFDDFILYCSIVSYSAVSIYPNRVDDSIFDDSIFDDSIFDDSIFDDSIFDDSIFYDSIFEKKLVLRSCSTRRSSSYMVTILSTIPAASYVSTW